MVGAVHQTQPLALLEVEEPHLRPHRDRRGVYLPQQRRLVQVYAVLEAAGNTAQVYPLHAARTVQVHRVINRYGSREGQRHAPAGYRLLGVAVASVLGVPVEIVGGVGKDPDGTGCVAGLSRKVHLHVVALVGVAAVLGVQQGEAVQDGVHPVAVVRAVQRVDERVFHPRLRHSVLHHRHTLRRWEDVLELAALVVGSLAPVPHLFLVEHTQHHLVGQDVPHGLGRRLQLFLEVGQYQAPQPRVVSLEAVFALVAVPCVTAQRIKVGKERVVSLAQLAVPVIPGDKPFQHIPCARYHILGTLVNAHEIVREGIVCQRVGDVEIVRRLVPELGANPFGLACRCPPARGAVVGVGRRHRAARHTGGLHEAVVYPAEETLDGRPLVCRGRGLSTSGSTAPHRVLGVVELKAVIKTGVELVAQRLAAGAAGRLEQAEWVGVVQSLQRNARTEVVFHLFIVRYLDMAEDVLRLALVMVEVVLAVILHGVGRIIRVRAEHVHREAVDGLAHTGVHLLRRRHVAQFPHQHVEQLGAARVHRHRAVTVVGLQADKHRLAVALAEYVAREAGVFHPLPVAASAVHLGGTRLQQVDAVVLARVLG